MKFKSNYANVEFSVERDENKEDVKRGQGGSVHNVLSVGLRMFALTTLDSQQHRRFLVLDEQDCWLQRELVPHLVKIVHDAGKELGYQVIMISHHELGLFQEYADKIYRFVPKYETQTSKDGQARKLAFVDVELVKSRGHRAGSPNLMVKLAAASSASTAHPALRSSASKPN